MQKFTSKIRLALVVASIPVLVAIPSKVGLSQFPPNPPNFPNWPEPPVVPPFAAAKAQISGNGNGITGTVWMVQTPVFVSVSVLLQGDPTILTPGLHGIHIHEKGSCDANTAFNSAGGHFDPGPSGNSAEANHPYHMGDLANIQVNASGVGILKTVSTRFTLSPSLLSLFDSNGSAIIVKKKADPMEAENSGGDRIACGVLETIPTPK